MAVRKATLGLTLLLIGGLLFLGQAQFVRADPTPTMTPWPIPSRQFGDLRPTPSPWAITPGASSFNIDGDTKAGELADTMINAYRFINFGATEEHGGVIDLVLFFAMGFMVIRALMALIQGTGEEDE